MLLGCEDKEIEVSAEAVGLLMNKLLLMVSSSSIVLWMLRYSVDVTLWFPVRQHL